jgi:hypothetical protein
MITKGACESFDKGMGLVTDLVFTLGKLINIGSEGRDMGVLHGRKVRPSKRKLTSKQAGRQAGRQEL